MKKLALTIAIVLGISFGAFAQGGGLFGKGETRGADNREESPLLVPGLPGHGSNDNNDAPLGTGALLLIGFGAAYAAAKKNK